MAAVEDLPDEDKWCDERRVQVTRYLEREGVTHGRIGEWPAWHLAPYVSVWAIESKKTPNSVGWWVICGDLPTDYVSAGDIKHPRDAVRAIAERWLEQATKMERGESLEGINVGSAEERASLAPLLKSRASTLLEWAIDDAVWNNDAL